MINYTISNKLQKNLNLFFFFNGKATLRKPWLIKHSYSAITIKYFSYWMNAI